MIALMGYCVHVYGVLFVGVLSRGVGWLMCVFNQAHAHSPEGKGKEKNTKKPKYIYWGVGEGGFKVKNAPHQSHTIP